MEEREKYWWYKTEWHKKTERALQLAGMSERTQECYIRAMRMLAEFSGKEPDLITEEELADYFLYRRNVTRWTGATMRICHAGIKFFYRNVLKREWDTLNLIKARREKTLPAVLSKEEVRHVLAEVTTPHNYACLATIYSCGLRLQEGLFLEVSDIDGERKMLHVHRGKGSKDRYVPLPEATYRLIRRYWATHRNPRFIFPAVGRGGIKGPVSTKPMSIEALQGAFRAARYAADIKKKESPSIP